MQGLRRGVGFRVKGVGFMVWISDFRFAGLGLGVWADGVAFEVWGLEAVVQGHVARCRFRVC